MILQTTLQWLKQNKIQSLNSQKTPHISPSWVSYGVFIAMIVENSRYHFIVHWTVSLISYNFNHHTVSSIILRLIKCASTLQWHHNGHGSASQLFTQPLFTRRSKKTSKPRVTGLCVGYSLGTSEFPAQMASYAENVSIWWHHNENDIWLW